MLLDILFWGTPFIKDYVVSLLSLFKKELYTSERKAIGTAIVP
jgi:hypothetical protein